MPHARLPSPGGGGSAPKAPGWGELRSKQIHPHPIAFAARKQSTSPLQGEVKRASGAGGGYRLQIVADSDAGARTAAGMTGRAAGGLTLPWRGRGGAEGAGVG